MHSKRFFFHVTDEMLEKKKCVVFISIGKEYGFAVGLSITGFFIYWDFWNVERDLVFYYLFHWT